MKRTITSAVLFAIVLAAAGCQPPTVPSPITGRPVTADQLAAEQQAEEAKVAKKSLAEKARAEAEIRAIKADAEASVRKLAADAKIADAQREQVLADVVAKADVNTQAVLAASSTSASQRDAALEDLKERFGASFDSLSAQYEQRAGLAKVVGSLPIVGQYAGAVGINNDGIGTILGAALGMGGMGWLGRRAREREDKAWDESHARTMAILTPAPGQKAGT